MIKNLPANAGDASLIPGSGRCPGEGNGNPLQYSCLGNPKDRRAWWATVHGVAKSCTALSEHQSPGFSSDSAGKESACNAGDLGSIPGLGRSPGEGKDYPLQYSGLENSMDSILHGVAKSRQRLSDFHFTEHQHIGLSFTYIKENYSN